MKLRVTKTDIQPLIALAERLPAHTINRMPARVFEKREKTISLADYFAALAVLSVAMNDETLNLSPRHLMSGSTDYIISSLAACSTLGDAMKQTAKSYNVLHGGPYNRLEQRDGDVFYIIDDKSFPYQADDQRYIHFTLECVLIYLSGLFECVAPGQVFPHLHKVYTRGLSGNRMSSHLGFWNVPIRFRSGYFGLRFSQDIMTVPVSASATVPVTIASVYERVLHLIGEKENRLRPEAMADRVRRLLIQGFSSQQQIATDLGASVPTLRRRLANEGASFRQVRSEVLCELAKQGLEQGQHVAYLAEKLGFADFRSLNRAFRGWTGETPSAYADRVRKNTKTAPY